MRQYAYLATLLLSAGLVLALDRRVGLGVAGRRLWRTVALTVPAFLALDAAGAARGWFASNPRLNSVILPPGIPLEEPILLAFLCMVGIALWRAAARWQR